MSWVCDGWKVEGGKLGVHGCRCEWGRAVVALEGLRGV